MNILMFEEPNMGGHGVVTVARGSADHAAS